MCIIAVKIPTAQHPDEETLKTMWSKNPDGAGIAYPDVNGGISVVKGLMTYEAFKEALAPLLALPTIFYLLHFRIATHGTVDAAMTHPFWVAENKVAMAHNGILPYASLVKYREGRSDTAAFTEDILSKLPADWYVQESWRHVVEQYMGAGNKIAVIEKDGVVLLNRNGWYDDKTTGLIYSNGGYKSYTTVVGGNQASNFRQGRSGSSAGSSSSKDIGTEVDLTSSEAAKRMATYRESRKKATDNFGKRCGSFVHQKTLTIDEARQLKKAVETMEWMPEEGEDFLDFYTQVIATMKPTKPTVMWAFRLLGSTELGKIPDLMVERQDRLNKEEEEFLLVNGLTADEPKDPLDTSSTTLTEPVWHSNNAGFFIGKPIRIILTDGQVRIGPCICLSDQGITYGTERGGQGMVAWDFIEDIEERLVLNCPRLRDLHNHLGCRVTVETLAKTHAFDGQLCALAPETFTVKSDMGITIQARYDEVLSITIDAGPEAAEAMAAKAK